MSIITKNLYNKRKGIQWVRKGLGLTQPKSEVYKKYILNKKIIKETYIF